MSEAIELELLPAHLPPSGPDNKSSLFDYRPVDPSFDALKFGAAASFQLPSAHSDSCKHAKNSENLLVVSPYTSRSHLLDLNSVDKPNQLVPKALTTMKPIREDYATAPYKEAFNWNEIMEVWQGLVEGKQYEWKERSFYVVVFKSQVPPTDGQITFG